MQSPEFGVSLTFISIGQSLLQLLQFLHEEAIFNLYKLNELNNERIAPSGHKYLQNDLNKAMQSIVTSANIVSPMINPTDEVCQPSPSIILHGIAASNVPAGHNLHIVNGDSIVKKYGIRIAKNIKTKYLKYFNFSRIFIVVEEIFFTKS